MVLTLEMVDDIRELWLQGQLGKNVEHFHDITLGAAFELACCYCDIIKDKNPVPNIISQWMRRWPMFARACHCLENYGFENVSHSTLWSAPSWEICSAPVNGEVYGNGWELFQQRFSRSLQNNAFSRSLALALAGALAEMSDNISEHSAPQDSVSAHGIVGFHVSPYRATFSVADLGQGVLSSLRKNPKWLYLDNSADALLEAVWNGASARIQEQQGDGFAEVHKAVSQLNGSMRYRSGGSILSVQGNLSERNINRSFGTNLAGFQLTVLCCLDTPESNEIKKIF